MGEDAAAKFLKRKSYKIKSRNFRSGHKEIDIVALDGDVLVFVEVKTRKETAPVGGSAFIREPSDRRLPFSK